MDRDATALSGTSGAVRRTLAGDFPSLPQGISTSTAIIGVITEAETSEIDDCTLVNMETGERDNCLLLVKHKAGFLVGKIALYDVTARVVSWIEDSMYRFRVLAAVADTVANEQAETFTTCPICNARQKWKNLKKHLRDAHWFQMLW